jgi:acetoin utilization deacetylase AcuC-like enzyme
MAAGRIGVFFTEKFKGLDWPIIGDRFKDFPEAFGDLLGNPGVAFYEPEPVSEELLLKVHSLSHLETVKAAWYYEGARLTVGGCVEALEKIWTGEVKSAIVLSVAAGHHAGPKSAWGGTYLSSFGPAITSLREKYGVKRFAILDTDSHHADGDRAMFRGDKNVLHVCFCSQNQVEEEGLKVDVNVGWQTTDEAYLRLVEEEFVVRAERFKPEMVLHSLGYDTCRGDYGDRGLTPDFFPKLASKVKDFADRACQSRYLIAIMGGASPQTANYIIPEIVRALLSEG